MTNPAMYFREAERIEAEMTRSQHRANANRKRRIEQPQSPATAYSRERLPSGCVLNRMAKIPKIHLKQI